MISNQQKPSSTSKFLRKFRTPNRAISAFRTSSKSPGRPSPLPGNIGGPSPLVLSSMAHTTTSNLKSPANSKSPTNRSVNSLFSLSSTPQARQQHSIQSSTPSYETNNKQNFDLEKKISKRR